MPLLTLDSLSFSRPDATPLFADITCSLGAGATGLVGANGAGKSTLLQILAGSLSATSGTFRRDGRVALLRQVFGPGETVADLFGCAPALSLLDRAAAGQGSVSELADADWTLEGRLDTALAHVGLGGLDPRAPLERLSGGQQRRAALAALVFGDPEIVLLDEPTNDLDADGRALVGQLLRDQGARGLALVASHDRALLEGMDRILALEAGRATLHGGGWSDFATARAAARARAQTRVEQADRAVSRVEARVADSTRKAAGRARQGRALRASGSQGKMLTDAMKDRAERRGAGAARLAERQREAARKEQSEARRALSPQVPRRLAAVAGRRHGTVLTFAEVGFRFDRDGAIFEGLSFSVDAGERVSLTGPNGSGKSTLLHLAAGHLAPRTGRIDRGTCAFLDQQADVLGHEGTLAEAFARYHPELGKNAIHAALARMGFRGVGGAAEITTLSGGERMQAALALALAGTTPLDLLLLDEPTNHLDLPALEAVEAGLAAFPGALIVASHDQAFLEALDLTRRFELPVCG